MAKVDSMGEAHPVAHNTCICQRCKQPIVLDSSFSTEDQLFADIISELSLEEQGDETRQSNVLESLARKYVGPTRLLSDSGNGFLVVGDSNDSPGTLSLSSSKTLGTAAQVKSHLFDLLSRDSDVEQPLCEECTDILLDLLDVNLRESQEEYEYYKKYSNELEGKQFENNEAALQEELTKLEEEEKKLLKQLDEVRDERTKATADLEKQKEEKSRLEAEHERYWQEYCKHKHQQMALADEQTSVNNQLRYAENQLNRLTKENVFNNTFHIWFNGQFGTINNFRLGRLPNVVVDWAEINAAWGQTVLLLHSLAKKKGVKFTNYRLVPYGNHSYIESLADKSKELPLYGSGGLKYFWDSRFDQAMVAFLECLQEFAIAARFALPYKIDKWKIEDKGNAYSVKMQFNCEEAWTKAMKFMLTDLKWGIAHVFGEEAAAKKGATNG